MKSIYERLNLIYEEKAKIARRLARGLAALGFALEGEPETNIVMFRAAEDPPFQQAARERGVLLGRAGPARLRAVTHLDVSSADVDEALNRLKPLGKG